MVSGTLSLSSAECFSPFLHSTRSLSVSREYLALPDGPGWFMQNYTCSALLRITLGKVALRVQDCHLILLFFPKYSSRLTFSFIVVLLPLLRNIRNRFGLFPVRSPLLRESFLFSFPRGTKMFQFPPLALLNIIGVTCLLHVRLSHSEILGLTVICT